MTFEMLFVYNITAAAATMDIREFRIPNWLNLLGLFFVLFFRVVEVLNNLVQGGGSGSYAKEMTCFALGVLVAFIETYPLFVVRGIGAGDVKLLCVLGGMLGSQRITGLIAVSYASAGIIGIVILTKELVFYIKNRNVRNKENITKCHVINFSLVICAAVILLPLVDLIVEGGLGGAF